MAGPKHPQLTIYANSSCGRSLVQCALPVSPAMRWLLAGYPKDKSRHPKDKSRHPTDKSRHPTDKSKHPTDNSGHQTDRSRHQTPKNREKMKDKSPYWALYIGMRALKCKETLYSVQSFPIADDLQPVEFPRNRCPTRMSSHALASSQLN